MSNQKTYQCAGDGMCVDPRCPTHSPPEMRALCARLTAPPSIALARMVMKRVGFYTHIEPVPRSEVHCGVCYPKSARYYEIIDRISRGEKP